MATILVDYENVYASDGLKGVDALRKEDTIIIFYSDACRRIRKDYLQWIQNSECTFRIVKLKNTGKNALDFYIAAECGRLYEQGERQLVIISNDKGFQAVLDYFHISNLKDDMHMVKAGNLENAFIMLNSKENARRSKELKEKRTLMNLEEEYKMIEEKNAIIARLEKLALVLVPSGESKKKN